MFPAAKWLDFLALITVETIIVITHLKLGMHLKQGERITTMSTLATPQTATATSTTTWNIDPAHSVAEFKVKHMMISNVKGQFPTVTGMLTLDETDQINSRVNA